MPAANALGKGVGASGRPVILVTWGVEVTDVTAHEGVAFWVFDGAVGDAFERVAGELAENVSGMGEAVRGAGDRFAVTDDVAGESSRIASSRDINCSVMRKLFTCR